MSLATQILTVTQGNLNNNHLYLTEVMHLFPEDVIGGENRTHAAPRLVRVLWGSESVDTDIVRAKHIFRRRGWVARFFAENRVGAGDRVLLEQLEPYLYRISRPTAEVFESAQVAVPDSEKRAAVDAVVEGEAACATCGQATQGEGRAIRSRGLGGVNWLTTPVTLCAGCFALLGADPGSERGRRLRCNQVEGAVSFWFRS